MVWIKQGAIGPVSVQVRMAVEKVAGILEARGDDLFITSLREGDHRAGSAHYDGRAFDMRLGAIALDELSALLGKGFKVCPPESDPGSEHDAHVEVL